MSQTPAEDEQDNKAKEPPKVNLSLPQILAGALAAVTTAVIGSQLGVAGTIIGAAIASVVGAVAGSLYTVGLDRTHRTVSAAIQRGFERVREPRPEEGEEPETPVEEETRKSTRRVLYQRIAIASGAILGVALLVITVLELGLGRALDGSEGTSVSQVGPSRPSTAATTAKPSATPTASATTVAPTPTPTPTQSATTVVPTPTSQPTSAEPTGAASAPTTSAPGEPTSAQTGG